MKIRDQHGLTLIELLAAITLLMIVLIPFTTLFFQGYKANFQNVEQLDTKIVATGIIEELKVGIKERKTVVGIAGENIDISNPSSVLVEDEQLTANGKSFDLSIDIEQYIPPNSVKTGSITTIPTNLYRISVTLEPTFKIGNSQPIHLEVIVKR